MAPSFFPRSAPDNKTDSVAKFNGTGVNGRGMEIWDRIAVSAANNEQIVAGIASGVAVANRESDALLREQNSLLRAMLEKETGTYLDGKLITKSVEKHQRERGRVLVTGGAY